MKKAPATTGAVKKSVTSAPQPTTAPKPKPPTKASPTPSAPAASNGPGMEDTYRTPTDELVSKKADVKSVRSELEDFEARLEKGEGPKRGPSRISPPVPTKSVAMTNRDPPKTHGHHGPSVPHGTAGGGGNAIAALRKATPTRLVTTEEEDEIAGRRKTDIDDVRNLPDSEDDDD